MSLSSASLSLAEAEARADALRQQLNQASHAYYVLAEPILPDQEYDRLYRQLVELEERHPHLVRPDSPTQRVGEPVEAGLPSVTHRIPLLSLDNVFAVEELPKWEQRLRRQLNVVDQPLAYSCELKVDGVALALRYEHGLLVQGATRGDGHRGEEITTSVRTIRSIPLRLQMADPPAWAEIRGEAFLAAATFSAINQQRRQRDEAPFANARNACAGTLRQLNPQVVASRKLDFVAYGLHLSPEQPQPQQQLAALDWLRAAGFKIDTHAQHCSAMAEVEQFYQHWNLQRHHLPYATDGVVVKLNELVLQVQAGRTQRAPRWAVAMKFSQMEARSTLRRLVAQVGRTGVVTPVAEFDPVELEGSTVARATLHNVDFIADKTDTGFLYAGDTLVVRKAGGVIPEVVKVEPCMSPLTLSSHCPECGSQLVRESKDELQWWRDNPATQLLLRDHPKLKTRFKQVFAPLEQEARCVNSSCPAILRSALRHWASRDALDIDGLDVQRIKQLVECDLVHTIDELYELQEATLAGLEGLAEPSAHSLLAALEASKQQPWSRVLYGLGIPHVGSANAKLLAQAFPSAEQLAEAFATNRKLGADKPLLDKLKGIGPKAASSVQRWLAEPSNQKLLAGVEASKQQWWPYVLSGLKIPGVGSVNAKLLAQAFPSAEQLKKAFASTQECLATDTRGIEGIGETHLSLQQWLANPANQMLLERLTQSNLRLHSHNKTAKSLQEWLAKPDNQKLLADVEASKQQWWPYALSGLKIPCAKLLAQSCSSAEQLAEAFAVTRQFLVTDAPNLEGIGHEITMSLQQWFANPVNQRLLERLAKAGLQLQVQVDRSRESAHGPLTGQTFVLTGTLPSLSRPEAQQRIEAAGGTVASSVSKKTTHLVVGANPGSKLDKARTLGIEILDEDALLQRLDCQQQDLALPNRDLGDLPLLKNMSEAIPADDHNPATQS